MPERFHCERYGTNVRGTDVLRMERLHAGRDGSLREGCENACCFPQMGPASQPFLRVNAYLAKPEELSDGDLRDRAHPVCLFRRAGISMAMGLRTSTNERSVDDSAAVWQRFGSEGDSVGGFIIEAPHLEVPENCRAGGRNSRLLVRRKCRP